MASLARWCYQHRYLVIVGWLVALAAFAGVSAAAGNAYDDAFALPGTESTKALDLLEQSFPQQAGEPGTIVWHADSGAVTDESVRSRIAPMLDQVRGMPHVTSVADPYTIADAPQVSADRTTAFATITFDGQVADVPKDAFSDIIDTAGAARTDSLRVELGGTGFQQVEQQDPGAATAVGLIAAAVILFLAFGSLLATTLPLITALVGLGAGTAVIGLLSHGLSISANGPTLASLIGVGVGIDYALFIVTRHRRGLLAGRTPEDSAVAAMNSSGRAVIFAGGTVCVALLGLLVLRVELLNGLAIPAALMVLFTMATAATLLPALLSVFGMRVLSRRERRRLAAEGPVPAGGGRGWQRWAEIVRRHPVSLGLTALVAVVLLALPLLSLRLGNSDQGNGPDSWTTRKAYDLLADGFGPGFNGPLQLVASTPHGPADEPTLTRLAAAVAATDGVASVDKPLVSGDQQVAVLRVVPSSAPQSEQTSDLIDELRRTVIPANVAGSGVSVHVGGVTATFDDFAEVLGGKIPLFLGVILLLGALLLLLAFRSVVVSLTSAVMNLLAAGAVLGVVTAVFQLGWGADLIGLSGIGPVDTFLPVMFIAILFGLSMDYQVFLVSRIHEEWARTGDNVRAVTVGVAETGRVITAAAAVMILVFSSFIPGGVRTVAEFGLGLAVAVLIDAFILRSVLVPATMFLLGRANWWLPRWLGAVLPHVAIEPADPELPPASRTAEPVPGRAR